MTAKFSPPIDINYKLPKTKGNFKGIEIPKFEPEYVMEQLESEAMRLEEERQDQIRLAIENEYQRQKQSEAMEEARLKAIEEAANLARLLDQLEQAAKEEAQRAEEACRLEELRREEENQRRLQEEAEEELRIQRELEEAELAKVKAALERVNSKRQQRITKSNPDVKPWLVIKTLRQDDRKVFINLCYHSEIPKDLVVVAVDSPRIDTDKKGEISSVYDIGVCSSVYTGIGIRETQDAVSDFVMLLLFDFYGYVYVCRCVSE
jgi:hypothetical protein